MLKRRKGSDLKDRVPGQRHAIFLLGVAGGLEVEGYNRGDGYLVDVRCLDHPVDKQRTVLPARRNQVDLVTEKA